MDHYYLLQILLIFLLIFSLTSGRALLSDELNSDDEVDFDSDETKEQKESHINLTDSDNDVSNEEKEVQERSALNSPRSPQSRQQLLDMLRKAYNQGWKPNLKHYIPATRFGRHRR